MFTLESAAAPELYASPDPSFGFAGAVTGINVPPCTRSLVGFGKVPGHTVTFASATI